MFSMSWLHQTGGRQMPEKWVEIKCNTRKHPSKCVYNNVVYNGGGGRGGSLLYFPSHEKDITSEEIPQRPAHSSSLLLWHISPHLRNHRRWQWFAEARKWFVTCVWQKFKTCTDVENTRKRSCFCSRVEFQPPCFRLISAMRRMSLYDNRDKNGTWRMYVLQSSVMHCQEKKKKRLYEQKKCFHTQCCWILFFIAVVKIKGRYERLMNGGVNTWTWTRKLGWLQVNHSNMWQTVYHWWVCTPVHMTLMCACASSVGWT